LNSEKRRLLITTIRNQIPIKTSQKVEIGDELFLIAGKSVPVKFAIN
jgi:hypothetical protein